MLLCLLLAFTFDGKVADTVWLVAVSDQRVVVYRTVLFLLYCTVLTSIGTS